MWDQDNIPDPKWLELLLKYFYFLPDALILQLALSQHQNVAWENLLLWLWVHIPVFQQCPDLMLISSVPQVRCKQKGALTSWFVLPGF